MKSHFHSSRSGVGDRRQNAGLLLLAIAFAMAAALVATIPSPSANLF